jgi:hypothetical protein
MRRADGERGSASLWALAAGLLVLLAALVVTVRTEASAGRHQADTAADLAAPAGARASGCSTRADLSGRSHGGAPQRRPGLVPGTPGRGGTDRDGDNAVRVAITLPIPRPHPRGPRPGGATARLTRPVPVQRAPWACVIHRASKWTSQPPPEMAPVTRCGMTLRVGSVVINCADIGVMTRFWVAARAQAAAGVGN